MDENGRGGYLVFVWSTGGYTLEERNGEPPQVGTQVEDGERRFRVVKLAPSPLPGDARSCAYLLPA
ncbi:MAG TPA: hypothetical protein VFB57_01100 [Gaiellaceae bacterium]|jgi:hypothetical protein|nr:hypothetical protein [Gaiellaceae bacterium]